MRRTCLILTFLAFVLLIGAVGANASSKPAAKSFSVFRIATDAPDYLDPALSYDGSAWQLTWNVYEGLLGYPHKSGAAGTELIPYLAQALPTVSNDGTVFHFQLRHNVRFSNGQIVKASDFRCTIDRLFKMDSPGVGFYNGISGVSGPNGYASNPTGEISGIQTNDSTGAITITLDRPEADFENVLALPFASIVPCSTPDSDQTAAGIPSAGPYMISSYQPNSQIVLTRNPYFSQRKTPAIPRGNPDKVIASIITDPTQAYEAVKTGQDDYDAESIPADRLSEAGSTYRARLELVDDPTTYYLFLNTRTAPFNSLAARQAVNEAINRQAFVKIFGGLAAATENILPPSYPQYQKITAYSPDLAKARALVRQSGTAGETVTIWGINSDPSQSGVEYLANVLQQLGWKVRLKLLAHSVYWSTIGDQSNQAQIGWASWGQDYPNPIDWLDTMFNGERITPTHNNDYGNTDFSDVDQAIDQLKHTPATIPAQNGAWANVEQLLIVKHAAAVPLVNPLDTDFFSSRVDLGCYVNSPVYRFDYASICVH